MMKYCFQPFYNQSYSAQTWLGRVLFWNNSYDFNMYNLGNFSRLMYGLIYLTKHNQVKTNNFFKKI
jgi:hypothetical protein